MLALIALIIAVASFIIVLVTDVRQNHQSWFTRHASLLLMFGVCSFISSIGLGILEAGERAEAVKTGCRAHCGDSRTLACGRFDFDTVTEDERVTTFVVCAGPDGPQLRWSSP